MMPQRLNHAFLLTLARPPRPEEAERLLAYLEQQQAIFESGRTAARDLLQNTAFDGDHGRASGVGGACQRAVESRRVHHARMNRCNCPLTASWHLSPRTFWPAVRTASAPWRCGICCRRKAARGAPQPHFAPRAKNVIFIFMAGGPSHLDLFDPKPKMAALHGQPMPTSLVKAKKSATGGVLETVMASPRTFQRYGQSGIEFSELLPHTGAMADELCLIRSMHCEQSNHDPAQLLLSCGTPLFGNPSFGSWVNYGLGSECQDMPGYVVLLSNSGKGVDAGSALWGSGFMPSSYRGVTFRSTGDPMLHLTNPPGISAASQRARLDVLRDLNQLHQAAHRRCRDRRAHRQLRVGLSHAIGRTGAARLQRRTGDVARRCTVSTTKRRGRSARTACSRGGWSSAACGSCSSFTPRGTITASWTRTSRSTAP